MLMFIFPTWKKSKMEGRSMMTNEELIEEVKKFSFLYNKRDRDYKNIIKKTRTWNEIGNKYNLTDEECMKRWKSIRDRFTRETKKMHDISVSGSTSQQLETPTWDLHGSLDFLHEHCEPNKRTTTNYKGSKSPAEEPESSTRGSECEEEKSEPSCSNSQQVPGSGAKRRTERNEINSTFIEAANSFKDMCAAYSQSQNQPSTDRKFADTVVAFISSIENEENKTIAKNAVLKYLAECVSGQFTTD